MTCLSVFWNNSRNKKRLSNKLYSLGTRPHKGNKEVDLLARGASKALIILLS